MAVDQIARAECAQFLHRAGVDLSALYDDVELARASAQALADESGSGFAEAAMVVEAIADWYRP